jgi:hypothetical protein
MNGMNGTVGSTVKSSINTVSGRPPVPEVVVIERGTNSYVVICPYCNKLHYHGRGGGLGGRRSDCLPGGEYWLVQRTKVVDGRKRVH